MMRIALVGPLPPPHGGMANQTLQLSKLLRAEGIDVELVQVNAPYRPRWVEKMRGVRALFRLLPYLARLWQAFGRADLVHLMANSGWSWHLFSAPAIWIAWLRKTPLIVNYRGGYAREFMEKQSKIVGLSLRRATRLVVPSGFLKAIFAQFDFDANIVPNIVDTDRFHPSPQRLGRAPVILVARNLEPIYDNATAIQAFKLVREAMPQARLVIAGSGPDEARLKKLAADLGLDRAIDFVGRIATDDMPALYARASVALNPSVVDNMPNSVLEALAAGVPVVSTNVGGVPFIVEHEKNALLIPPVEPVAMAAAVLRVLQDPLLAERLATQGRSTALAYAWPQVRERLLHTYHDAIGRPVSALP